MAYHVVTKRGNKYQAQVKVKEGGKTVYSEARTFPRRALAEDWGKRRAVELSAPEAVQAAKQKHITLRSLILRYRQEFGALSRFGRTKRFELDRLEKAEIASKPFDRIKTADYVSHVRERRLSGAGPATAGNDLIWLRVVAKTARAAWGIPIDLQPIDDAAHWLRSQGLISKAGKRERRPTAEELDRLDRYFSEHMTGYPMRDLMWFAVHSCRRQAEITRILWEDNREDLTGLVRDVKHPTRKEGNHKRFRYTQEAWEIAHRQPKTDPRIFPYNSKTIGSYFTDACHILGIVDLHFHDLRREGVSRLFEAGYQIHEVQQYSLHESWSELKRYTHLIPK